MNTQLAVKTAAVLLAFSIFGCKAREEMSTTHTTSAPTAPATVEAQKKVEPLTTADKDFITKQAQERMEEVAAGKAIQRSTASADVKAFAGRQVTESSRALDELKSMAEKKGLTLPSQLDDDRQAHIDKLAKLTGKKLDKQYASDMVDERQEDVKQFKDASQKLYDPDLKAWAAGKVSLFENELTSAKDIDAKAKKE